MVGEIINKNNKFEVNVQSYHVSNLKLKKKQKILYLLKTDFATNTKYHSYQLPGGENYRELLLTLPEKDFRY